MALRQQDGINGVVFEVFDHLNISEKNMSFPITSFKRAGVGATHKHTK